MIQRTTLPNLANQLAKEKASIHQMQRIKRSQVDYQSKRPDQSSRMYLTEKKNHKKLNKLNTQPALNSQTSTLEMKLFDSPDIFQLTKTKSLTQPNSLAPYFYKIQNSHKILQNSDDLKRKLTQAKKQETQRLRITTIEQSKKSNRRLISSLSKTATQSVGTLTDRHHNDILHPQQQSLPQTCYPSIQPTTKHSDQFQLTSLSSTLKNRKHQLTQNAKQARYTFEHFNSGQIFAQIALINQNKLLGDQMYGTIYSLKGRKRSYMMKKQLQESFKDQYNTFLRSKLPPSFGQNGNKTSIYEEYVVKRRQQHKRSIQSKLVEGKFLRTQPAPAIQQEFIFTNDISAISAKKIKIQMAYVEKLGIQQSKINKFCTEQQKKQDLSATTSKVVTHTNTKVNTLRQGQTFLNKLKLKKLVKLTQKEKERSKTLNKHKQSSLKSRIHSRGANSSFSDYENTLSQAEMNKLLLKSNLILGRVPVVEVVNPQLLQSSIDNSTIQKPPQNHQQYNQLNEFQQQHLANVDRLLCKQQTILRKDKQDLDSLPWRISIKVSKQSNL